MNNQSKQTLNLIILISLLVVTIVLLGTVVYLMINGHHKCSSNPLVYGLQELEKNNEESIAQCSCTISSKGISESFFINSHELKLEEEIDYHYGDEINISKFIIN